MGFSDMLEDFLEEEADSKFGKLLQKFAKKLWKKYFNDDGDEDEQPEVPGEEFHVPRFLRVVPLTKAPSEGSGFAVCTENYMAYYIPTYKDRGGSICFIHVEIHGEDGSVEKVHYNNMEPRNQYRKGKAHTGCPGGAKNWTDNGDHPGEKKSYLYTTAYPDKEAGADGTRRGYAFVPFSKPGRYDVKIRYRPTGNRTFQGFVVLYSKKIRNGQEEWAAHCYSWNQRGDGIHRTVTLAEGFRFFEEISQ